LAASRASRYGMMTTGFTSALAEGLAGSGRTTEALETIDKQIAQVQESGDLFYMPELLRIKGDIQAGGSPDQDMEAERTLLQSLDWARRQEALSWELRSATSLAQLYLSRGRLEQAEALLAPIYERFTEGFATPDLVRARRLLEAT
jgi:predicted ATPase